MKAACTRRSITYEYIYWTIYISLNILIVGQWGCYTLATCSCNKQTNPRDFTENFGYTGLMLQSVLLNCLQHLVRPGWVSLLVEWLLCNFMLPVKGVWSHTRKNVEMLGEYATALVFTLSQRV